MKNTDPICPILLTLLTHVYTFSQMLVVLITASTKVAMTIMYSKTLELNIES